MHTRSEQSLDCQLRLHMHMSYDVHLPWPLHALAHSALILATSEAQTKRMKRLGVILSIPMEKDSLIEQRRLGADESLPSRPIM